MEGLSCIWNQEIFAFKLQIHPIFLTFSSWFATRVERDGAAQLNLRKPEAAMDEVISVCSLEQVR